MKTCVIIPTYNEADAIGNLVNRIRRQNLEVVVIDDGSVDSTASIAQKNGAIILKNAVNMGKGASLVKGFQYALNQGFEAVITIDGDGQHAPEEIPGFIKAAESSDAQIILGNRMSEVKNMPLTRILTNRFMSWFISKITGQYIPDSQCGFRLLKRELLEKHSLKTSKYETESEILIQASRLKFKIDSINIKTIYVKEISRINPLIDTLRFIRYILTNRM